MRSAKLGNHLKLVVFLGDEELMFLWLLETMISPTWDGTAILRGHPSHTKV